MIMSYETMRIDVDWVASQQWDYCVLDEGHAIRNIESKVTLHGCFDTSAAPDCVGTALGMVCLQTHPSKASAYSERHPAAEQCH